ncbi:MAG: aminotransferase class IV [Minisyncoccia bacterium]
MKITQCFLNGKIIPLKKAGISPQDLGLMRGYALLEVLRTYNNKIFAFNDHYQRLKNGADFLHLKIPFPKEKIEQIIYHLIKINQLKEAKITIILSAGVSDESFKIPEKQTLFIETEPLQTYPPVFYENGIKIISLNYKRNNPQIKITNYIEAIRFHHLLEKKKAQELLYVYDNQVYECSSSNIFIFTKNQLITPNHAVLPGVTRKYVIKLAKKYVPVSIRPLTYKELVKANEVFITSTTREILPVVKIDQYQIKDGKVGEKTKFLMQKWQEFIKKNYYKE